MAQKLWARLPIKMEHRQACKVELDRVPTLRQLAAVKSRALYDPCRLPAVTNSDILELVFTLRTSSNTSAMPLLHAYLIDSNFIPNGTDVKCLWRKINDVEKQFMKLKKNHNARCAREGSHQTMQLNDYLAKPFYPTACLHSTEVHDTDDYHTPRETKVCGPVPSTPSRVSMTASNHETRPVKSDAGVQVSSPQIRTEGQVRRTERKVKRQLMFSNTKIENLQQTVKINEGKLRQSELKRNKMMKTVRYRRDKLIGLSNRVKQLSANLKKVSPLVKEKDKSEKELHRSNAVITKLIDDNSELEMSIQQLSNTLTVQKQKTRQLQKRVSKFKNKKEKVEKSISNLCAKLESGHDVVQYVADICDEVCSLGGNKTLIQTLASAIRSPLPMKNKSAYSDHVTLLMIELQNLGVPQASVGNVANACTKHLCGRELDHLVSRRTAGRMVRRGGILSDIQVAVELTENASRGLRIGQDTTTRRGTEHVSTIWGVHKDDGTIRYLQSRIKWLPNHTADEQSKHVMQELERCNAILDDMDISPPKKLSIAYIVEFIGDHVNNKLHRNLEANHLREIADLVACNSITNEERERLQFLYKSACQQHSCAKVSRSFFEGMQKEEPPELSGSIGKYGLQQKKGRSYEAAASKIIETASVQLSPDFANTSSTDYNWANIYQGWCLANNKHYQRIGYVNKNRHYRHEYEARKIIQSSQSIIDFYNSRRETRDDLNNKQTLRNRDHIVLQALQKEDVQAELVAADSMRYTFYSPFLVMVKDDKTDVLSIGNHIRQFHDLLNEVATNDLKASDVLNGNCVLFDGQFGSEFTKPVGIATYGDSPNVIEKAQRYLKAGCKAAATGLYSISREYFTDGGQYFLPTDHMQSVLSGLEAHTDRNEGNFGQFSQQLRKDPTGRLQTINSKVAMRANNTIHEARENPTLMNCVGKTRKLERIESEVTIQCQLEKISKDNEPHLQTIRKLVAQRQEKRREKTEILRAQIKKDGQMRSIKDVNRLSTDYARQSELKHVLKKHILYLKSENPQIVADRKDLFVFSKEKKVLTVQELKVNLKLIVSLAESCPFEESSSDEDSDYTALDDSNEMCESAEDDEQIQHPPASFANSDIDRCLVVGFVDRWYPGFVSKVNSKTSACVNFLHPVKKYPLCATFRWPRERDEFDVSIKAVVCFDVELAPQGMSFRLWKLSNVKSIDKLYQ